MQNIPKIVRARLQRPTLEAALRHPDADLLTAFAEQSLAESERRNVVEHLASCAGCREVIALALPASEAVPVPGSSRAAQAGWISSGWLNWPVLRWSVVAAGLVLVTSVGILQYKHRTQQNVAMVSSPVRQEEKAVTTLPSSQPSSDAAAIVLPAPEIAEQTTVRKLSRGQQTRNTEQPSSSMFPSPRSLGFARSSKEAVPAASGSPASPPTMPTRRDAISGASQMVEAESARIAAQDHAGEQLAQNRPDDLSSKSQALSNNLDVVKAKDSVSPQTGSTVAPTVAIPDLSLQNGLRAFPQWAISSKGALQRSFDTGRTWEDVNPSQSSLTSGARMENTTELKAQYSDKQSGDKKIRKEDRTKPVAIFRAVAAVGREVWAGGSSAMLYHSLDSGSHWRQVVPLEANASLTGDIVGVEFSDIQHGKISTAAGEIWMTGDDGETWHRQQ